MRRMKERLFATSLALLLALGSIPVAARAEEAAIPAEEPPVVVVLDEAQPEPEADDEAEDEAAVDDALTETPEEEADAEQPAAPEPEAEPEIAESDLQGSSNEPTDSEASDPSDSSDPEPSHDLANATITVADQTYTGEEVEPTPSVTLDGVELTPDVDFQYWFDFGGNIDAGTAKVHLAGMGDYTGMVSTTFVIKPRSIAKTSVDAISAKTYTGKAIKPSPSVHTTYEDLKKGTDYTLTYKNNVKVGTATVVIAGKGNYTGKVSKSFKINAVSIAKASVAKVGTQKWTGKALKPKPVVKFGGKALKAGTDYTLTYKNNRKPNAKATITITGKGNFKGSRSVTFKVGPKTGAWKKSGSKWWWRWADGSCPKAKFERIDGAWYYFDASGWMVTGWRSVGGTWYYFNGSGVMVTGWRSIGGSWYYFNASGAMARNTWVGDYYLGSSGAMLKNTTTPDGYRVGSDGKWIKNSSGSGSYGTVYWTPYGEVWHSTPNCSTLSRSRTIYSGTIAQSGKPRGCHVCS